MMNIELLNILYAERERVEKQYAHPGWTIWALLAAIATLGWMIWDLLNDKVIWSSVVFVFYAWLFAYLIFEGIKNVIPSSKRIPVVKTNVETIVGEVGVCLLMIGLIVVQLIVIPGTFHTLLYWCAFVGILLYFLYICYLLYQQVGSVRIIKYEKLVSILANCCYIPISVLIILYLCQSGYEQTTYKIGTLFFAIWFLLGKIPLEEKRTFLQIDKLINKVLYEDEEVNEKAILEELEVYIIGLRYGKFLSATKLKELKPLVSELIKHSDALVKDVQSGNKVGVEAILSAGQKIYKDTKELYSSLMSDVNGIYGDDKNSEKSLTHIFAVGKIAEETMRFWSIVMGTMTLKSSEDVLKNHISAAYHSTIGKPEIQLLIEQELNDNMGEMG